MQPLYRSGIRYVQFGPNTMHYALPALFYLKAPRDPESRVLMWLTPNVGEYGENTTLGLRPPGPASPLEPHDPNALLPVDYPERVEAHLSWLQSRGLPLPGILERFDMRGVHFDYPYDAYLVSYYPAHDGDVREHPGPLQRHASVDGRPTADNMFHHWLDVSNDDFGVTFTARESGAVVPGDFVEVAKGAFGQAPFAPLVEGGWYHLTVGPTWLGRLLFGGESGHDFTFHAGLTSHQGPGDAVGSFGEVSTAAQFGWGFTTPIEAVVIGAPQRGVLPPAASFVAV